jgi:hypothetical protein
MLASQFFGRQVSPYTVRTDDTPKVHFTVTLGEEPGVEVGLV